MHGTTGENQFCDKQLLHVYSNKVPKTKNINKHCMQFSNIHRTLQQQPSTFCHCYADTMLIIINKGK